MKNLRSDDQKNEMKFFADECCDAELVAALRNEGYDVVYAAEDFYGKSSGSGLKS